MQTSQKYLHDKLVLLLVSSNVFLAFLCIVLLFLSLGIGQSGSGYIVQYRSNLGLSSFMRGGLTDMLGFVGIAIAVPTIGILLSARTYTVRRLLSLTILGSGVLLLILAIIVSNALMVLR
jgi:hypothetical protein